jgi:ribosomal protein S12 methylthiotransferase accessory factor
MARELAEFPPTCVEESLERLDRAVSPLVGIVRDVSQLMPAADEPRLTAFACALASSAATTGWSTVEYAGSAHVSPTRARAASIGEALERYSATFVPDDQLVTTASELGTAAVAPDSFALFHERQFVSGFPFVPFEPTRRLSFTEAFSLLDGSPAFVPAQLVYLHPPRKDERLIGYPTSNGLACGPTLEEAILAGLLELVERDAMMIAWSNRLTLPRLAWREHVEIAREDAQLFAPTGLRYSALDASGFFGIPATIGILHGSPGEAAALAFGAGCAKSIVDAWRTCLAEAFSVHRWLRTILQAEPDRRVGSPADVRTLDDHMLFFGTGERSDRTRFLEASSCERDSRDVPTLPGRTATATIDEIVRRLDERGVSAYAVDVTSPDVEELGVKVVRVVAPQLCALDVFGTAPYRGGTRRYTAASEAGLSNSPLDFDDLNPLPHPYP